MSKTRDLELIYTQSRTIYEMHKEIHRSFTESEMLISDLAEQAGMSCRKLEKILKNSTMDITIGTYTALMFVLNRRIKENGGW